MPFHATVLYPNDPDTKFDLDYYLKTHMPLVENAFKKHGLVKWEVLEYKPGPDGTPPKFVVGGTLVWDSPEQMGAAMTSEDAKPVLGDIPNFCNKQPIFLGGPLVAKSSY
ncbi:hypothetical protein AYO20_11367 [Fonsecaea nubica]|uniref:EthD domain-containing protein n=2 Tax=Fonsecaea TaxID=40354 RepID=A0A0D2H0Q1_9EURO|nr:uncharacterized protein Z517_03690 [Fonsecaea pedrosoi CBS 271.37]XP_022494412.1 hypothetical protein AYO20_11367 [Fonsecaea nubica]KAH0836137.1 hypothetical protein FOPE_04510 [Fonsecaea pedrosoi]KIW84440.1 hypothetical protein Z517_03690 [Fonsecaea pedrosoi CBS 271.37]OAL21430.1 hypothetical protein AYO20_11367 [Fonsecaea nubica]